MSTPLRPVRVRAAHVSMQHSDTATEMRADAVRLFRRERSRGAWWVTGTEAGGGSLRDALESAARRFDYRLHVRRDVWVAVAKERVAGGSWETGFEEAVDHTEGRGKHGDIGVAWASFSDHMLGRISVGCSHFLTKGRPVGPARMRVNLDHNREAAAVVGRWGVERGKGSALAFYAGDQNIVDTGRHAKADTFLGEAEFTSAADELGRWENTGHGAIDVLASFDRDRRVSAVETYVLDDREFFLNTDHFLVEAAFDVKPLPLGSRS